DAELHGVAWKLVDANDGRKEHMLNVLCPSPETRPWNIYAKEQESKEPRAALTAYSANVMDTLRLKATEISKVVKGRIYEIIDQTEGLIDDIKCSGVSTLAQFGFQNQQQEQKLKTQQNERAKTNSGVDTKTKFESYGQADSLQFGYQVQFSDFKVMQINHKKLPEFSIPKQANATPRADWKDAVKPLSHLMVVQESLGKWKYYALTEAGARFYVHDAQKIPQKVFIVAIGKTVLTSGTLLSKDCQEQIESPRFSQVVTLLNLMSGRAFDAHALIATIRDLGWNREDYKAFCNYIRTITPPDESYSPEKYEPELFGQ
ncbi:MAG: hypothetical protein LLF94_05120, partial [Chlamydiales bacterium]|nr:hypothetical protein [Chlamydiales bacterium]